MMPQNKPGDRAPYHDELIEYMSSPFDKRTWDQFAESVGVSDTTIYRYRMLNRDQIAREVEALRKKHVSEMRSRAMKSLIKKVDKADVNALKLFFQLAGDLVERTETKVDMMTREEKEAKARAMIEEAAKKFNIKKPEVTDGPTEPS